MADAAAVADVLAATRPGSRGARRRLGSYANKSSPGSETPVTPELIEQRRRRNGSRRTRYGLRAKLRTITALARVRNCGYATVNGGEAGPCLRVSEIDGRQCAGLTGLLTCGSIWACPACAAKIATRRADELADVMRFALEKGCSASMVTLTMRHHKGQSLEQCWDALSKAWARVTSGKQWVNDQQAAGLQGWVKAVEVTHGKNGWHVHIHALMIWRDSISQEAANAVGERMWTRWSRALQKRGFDSLRDSGGLDVRLATLRPGTDSGLHEYFVKLSHEITGGQAKLAKGGGRTPFQLLADAFDTQRADDFDTWWEWEEASRGRRQMAWSKGLRDWAELEPEQSDEEIAQEELEGEDLLALPIATWRVLRDDSSRVCELLEAAERGGLAAAAALLDASGLAWIPGKAPPPLARLRDHRLERGKTEEAAALVKSLHRMLWKDKPVIREP